MGIHLNVQRQQSLATSYVIGALRPRAGLGPGKRVPDISLTWAGARIDRRHLDRYLQARGLEHASGDQRLPLLYPLALSFPLHMQVLTHPLFPLRYVRMLQVRCHVSRYLPLVPDQQLTIRCGIVGRRVLPNGLEVDFHTMITVEDRGTSRRAWENVNVYYFPGRFGEPDAPAGFSRLGPLHQDEVLARWRNSKSDRWRFARLSGDLNGLHVCRTYAKLLGYERDFSHAQAIFSDCVKRLDPTLVSQQQLRLDAYLKGPVYYQRELVMRGASGPRRARFDLFCADNPRPSVSGELYAIQREGSLI